MGEKRSEEQLKDSSDKRTTLHAWGGKRGVTSKETRLSHGHDRYKRGFEPWDGKKSVLDITSNTDHLYDDDNNDRFLDKRQFTKFGGRTIELPLKNNREFNPWGGKRSVRTRHTRSALLLEAIRLAPPWKAKRPEFGEEKDDCVTYIL